MPTNPYTSPTNLPNVASPQEPVAADLRTKYLSCKGLGIVYLVCGCIFLLIGFMLVLSAFWPSPTDAGSGWWELLIALILGVGIGVPLTIVGFGLFRLRPWSRSPAIFISILGLFAFPLGTIVCGWLLVVLLSEQGKRLFAPA